MAALRPSRTTIAGALRPHQRDAVEALCGVLTGFNTRAQVVHPDGTGKTRIAAAFAEKHQARNVLIVLPSLTEVAAVIAEWTSLTTHYGRHIDYRVVGNNEPGCFTDRTLASHTRLLRDPASIAAFMKMRTSAPVKILFTTYDTTPRVAQAAAIAATQGWTHFDLAVCDDAHCLAAEPVTRPGSVLSQSAIPCRHRIFMTATPEIRNPWGVNAVRMGLSDPYRFGPIAHRFTYDAAVEANLVSPYRVTVLGLDSRKIDGIVFNTDLDSPAVRAQAAAQATLLMMNQTNAQRFTSLHATGDDAERFNTLLRAANRGVWPTHVSELTSLAVHAGTTTLARNSIRGLLTGDHGYPMALAQPRNLTEGLPVPNLDGVVFADHRGTIRDTIRIFGQVTRSSTTTEGHIVIPVAVRPGENPVTATKRASFRSAFEVISTLRDIDAGLAAHLDAEARTANGELPPQIHFTLPSSFDEYDSDRLRKIFSLRLAHQVSPVQGPDVVDVYCDCCGKYLEDRINLAA